MISFYFDGRLFTGSRIDDENLIGLIESQLEELTHTDNYQILIESAAKPTAIEIFYKKNRIARITNSNSILKVSTKKYLVECFLSNEIKRLIAKNTNYVTFKILLSNQEELEIYFLEDLKIAGYKTEKEFFKPTFHIDYVNLQSTIYGDFIEVNGWCFFGEEELNSIEIKILSNSNLVGSVKAINGRSDVAKTYGLSNDKIGFSLKIRSNYIYIPLEICFENSTHYYIENLEIKEKKGELNRGFKPKLVEKTDKLLKPININNTKLISFVIYTDFRNQYSLETLFELKKACKDDELIILAHNMPKNLNDLVRNLGSYVIEMEGEYNWASYYNYAASLAKNSYLAFISSNIIPVNDEWRMFLDKSLNEKIVLGGNIYSYIKNKKNYGKYILGSKAVDLEDDLSELDSISHLFIAINKITFQKLDGFKSDLSPENSCIEFCIRARKNLLTLKSHREISFLLRELSESETLSDNYYDDELLNSLSFLEYEPAQVKEDIFSDFSLEPLSYSYYSTNSYENIGIIKVDHIGDFYSSIPAFRLIRQLFSDSKITVFCSPEIMDVALSLKIFDYAIPYRAFSKRSELGKSNRLPIYSEINFDLLLDFRKHGDSRELIKNLKSKKKFALSQSRSESESLNANGIATFITEVDGQENQFLSIWQEELAFANYAYEASHYSFKNFSDFLAPKTIIQKEVLIFPFSGSQVREWPLDLYMRTALIFRRNSSNIPISFVTPIDDRWKFHNYLQEMKKHNITLHCTSNLQDVTKLIKKNSLILCNNSGPMWMASEAGAQFISIFSGVVNKNHWLPKGGIGISRKTSCNPCHISQVQQCHRDLDCLKTISPYAVLNAINTSKGWK